MPIARYAVTALLALAALFGVILLVRPLIFSLAPPLVSFPTTTGNGAVVVDFTRPIDLPAS